LLVHALLTRAHALILRATVLHTEIGLDVTVNAFERAASAARWLASFVGDALEHRASASGNFGDNLLALEARWHLGRVARSVHASVTARAAALVAGYNCFNLLALAFVAF
jgi:hypothetical protein